MENAYHSDRYEIPTRQCSASYQETPSHSSSKAPSSSQSSNLTSTRQAHNQLTKRPHTAVAHIPSDCSHWFGKTHKRRSAISSTDRTSDIQSASRAWLSRHRLEMLRPRRRLQPSNWGGCRKFGTWSLGSRRSKTRLGRSLAGCRGRRL